MSTPASTIERRSGVERRLRRVSVVLPERRSGFDRRASVGRWSRLLLDLRTAPHLVAAVAIGFFALNLADLVLTYRALGMGATELNPVMAAAIEVGPGVAATVKLAVGLGVAGGIWLGRRYRRVLAAAVVVTAAMAALVGYETMILSAI